MMSELSVDLIIFSQPEDPAFTTPLRILLIEECRVWVIPVVFGKGQGYARGPAQYAEDYIVDMIRAGRLTLAEFVPPALWSIPDSDLNQLYSGDRNTPCAAIIKRDIAWQAIDPYVKEHSVEEALKTMSFRQWIPQRSAELGRWPSWLSDKLHRYWAGGTKQALLANTAYCGAPGIEKPQNTKLGRPNSLTSEALKRNDAVAASETCGFVMTQEDKKKVQFGWRAFSPDRSKHQRYLETMGAFYRESIEVLDGMPRAVLLPVNQRPTERQWTCWGPKSESPPGECGLPNIPRPNPTRLRLPGNANQYVQKIGQIGWADSSGGDVELTSISSRLICVGRATFLELMDARTEVICGLYIGFEPPSARIALLAAAHAAMPKGEWCARFGIHGVTDDEIPAVRLNTIFTDNGEFRNALCMKVYLEAWDGWIIYAPAGKPTAKARIECDHNVRHMQLDHQLTGTTHGRMQEYGEPDPKEEAALNGYEYTRLHIERALYHNTEEPVPHLLTGEMRKDLTASATRMDVYRWLKTYGYISGRPPSPDLIRARMLPSYDATVTSRGILVQRPDRGNKKEYILGCRFFNDYLHESGMLASAQKHVIPIQIKMDPADPTMAWLPTRERLLPLTNVYRDDLLVARGSVHELCAIQDSDALVRLKDLARHDQADFDFVQTREATNRSAIEQRNRERIAVESGLAPAPVDQTMHERRKAELRALSEQGLASPVDVCSRTAGPPPTQTTDAASHREPVNPQANRGPTINQDTLAAIAAFKQARTKS
jgi:hypothetical protein